jgi:hemerythrin-like domain-containing protein
LTTWDSLHREHAEMFTKVNLLEKALIDFLQKRTTGLLEKTSDQQKAFLEAFEHGITLHFAVEEEALFPQLKTTGKNAETLINEPLSEHSSIMQKYGQIMQAPHNDEKKKETLLKMLTELQAHNRKEERTVPPVVAQLSLEQLGKVDQAAKRLGYQV